MFMDRLDSLALWLLVDWVGYLIKSFIKAVLRGSYWFLFLVYFLFLNFRRRKGRSFWHLAWLRVFFNYRRRPRYKKSLLCCLNYLRRRPRCGEGLLWCLILVNLMFWNYGLLFLTYSNGIRYSDLTCLGFFITVLRRILVPFGCS